MVLESSTATTAFQFLILSDPASSNAFPPPHPQKLFHLAPFSFKRSYLDVHLTSKYPPPPTQRPAPHPSASVSSSFRCLPWQPVLHTLAPAPAADARRCCLPRARAPAAPPRAPFAASRAGAAASPTREARLLSLCPTREPVFSPPDWETASLLPAPNDS